MLRSAVPLRRNKPNNKEDITSMTAEKKEPAKKKAAAKKAPAKKAAAPKKAAQPKKAASSPSGLAPMTGAVAPKNETSTAPFKAEVKINVTAPSAETVAKEVAKAVEEKVKKGFFSRLFRR
jgi:histone H1/5